MISKLFPRILNKSSDKTAVKSSEFSDALNILVTGDDGGDSNIIKKADGNIAATINDPENFPIQGDTGVIKETVLGKYEDQERSRVYYFTFGQEDGNTSVSYSSIYLLERITESDFKFILLLRTKSTDDPSVDLGFQRDDFIPANIIQTPKLKRDSALDNLNEGSTGDVDSDFDLNDSGDSSPTVAISVVEETLFISGTPGGDFGEVFDDADLNTPLTTSFGYFIIQNNGTTTGEVVISAQITNSVNGASVSIPSTVTIAPGNQLVVDFDIVLDVAAFQTAGGTFGTGGVDVQALITLQEVITQDAASLTEYFETFSSEVTFMLPQPLLPLSLSITSPLTSEAVNFPTNFGSATSIGQEFFIPDGVGTYVAALQLPENQFSTLIGPFQISFDEWEEAAQGSPVNLYNDVRVEISLEGAYENEQGQFGFWEIIDANDQAAINNTTTATGTTSIYFEKPGGVLSDSDAVANFASFYVRKAFDTSTWLDDGYDSIVFTKLRASVQESSSNTGTGWSGLGVTSPSFPIAASAGVGISSGVAQFHEIGVFGNVVNVPTPSNIQVTNVSWGSQATLISLESNVDDGTSSSNNGSVKTEKITVTNLGELGGWFFPSCLWAAKSWTIVESAGDLAAANSEQIYGYPAWQIFRGAYDLVTISYESGTTTFNVKPWSEEVLGDQNPSWVKLANDQALFGNQSFNTGSPPIAYLGPGESTDITITWSNIDSDFEYGAIGASDFGEQDDDQITTTYEGTNGPFYYYGQPDTNTGQTFGNFYPSGLPNHELMAFDVYVKNSPAPSTDVNDYSVAWGNSNGNDNGTVVVTVDGNFEGPLAVSAHKTSMWRANLQPSSFPGHPLGINTFMINAAFQGAPNATVGWGGSNYFGERPFFLGVYPDNEPSAGSQGSFISINANNSGAGVNGTAQTPEFWFGTDNSWNQQKADFLFINTTTESNAGDVTLEVLMETFDIWFYDTGTNSVSQSLPQGVSITTEFSLDNFSTNVHQPTPQNGGIGDDFDPIPDGLGSLGPSMIFSNPIPLESWSGEPSSVFRPDGTSYNSWTTKFDGSTSYNFPQFDDGLTSNQVPFPFYLNGFRYNQISIPPNHLVVGRAQFKWQIKGSQNPQTGMEDILNAPGVDFSNPNNIYGMPATVRAKWSGGVSNQLPNYVTIGNVMGLVNNQQLQALQNY